MNNKLQRSLVHIGLWLSGTGGVLGLAGAATYNLYFNNVEQGDNSTATPSVSLSTDANGKVVEAKKDPGTPEATPPAPAEETPAPATTPAPTAQSTAMVNTTSSTANYKWRAIVSTGILNESSGGYFNDPYVSHSGDGGYSSYNYYYNDGVSFNGSLGYFPLEYMGFNAFVGVADKLYGGFELEITPIKFNFFGFKDALEIGGMVGISTLAAAQGNVASAHLGLRAGWNFGERWLLSANVRGNAGFVSGDAGLGMRF